MDKSGIRKRDKATGVSQSTSSASSKSDRIGAEISQIDSVLKALNMGQFDLATISSFTDTTATPQSQEKPQSSQPGQSRYTHMYIVHAVYAMSVVTGVYHTCCIEARYHLNLHVHVHVHGRCHSLHNGSNSSSIYIVLHGYLDQHSYTLLYQPTSHNLRHLIKA